jgi:hypothetical protein
MLLLAKQFLQASLLFAGVPTVVVVLLLLSLQLLLHACIPVIVSGRSIAVILAVASQLLFASTDQL